MLVYLEAGKGLKAKAKNSNYYSPAYGFSLKKLRGYFIWKDL